MVPLFGTHTKSTTVIRLRGAAQAARLIKSRYSRYSSVSDVFGMAASFSKETRSSNYYFYKIINGLAQVPFEGVLVEAYKGTRRKHNMKFRQIGQTTSQYR